MNFQVKSTAFMLIAMVCTASTACNNKNPEK